jgi:hypothetical protein
MHPGAYVARAFLIAVAACAGSPEPLPGPSVPSSTEAELQIRATADGLELTNNGPTTIYYQARDPLSLALSGPIPCLDPGSCLHVPARDRVTVPFEQAIVGYRAETARATVYWWHFLPQPDGSVAPDEVRTLEVSLEAR